MVHLRRPSERAIDAVLGSMPPLSYPDVGATAWLDAPDVREALAARYVVDRHEFALGTGRALFERARSALLAWRHFEIPWLALHGATAPARAGQIVATLTRVAGLWFVNPCRVVYVEQGAGDASTEVAFAYGTLEGHAVSGEERFAVAFDPGSGQVRYEIAAFSRPAILLSRLGYPFARRLQRRFAVSSARALTRAAAEAP